jgi:solute:Na+ symporter, SSS family
MNCYLLFIILIFFTFVYLYIAKKTLSDAKNNDDYFLSKKNLGVFSLSMTLLATQLGGGSLVGAANEAFFKGWIVIFYPMGISLGLILLSLGIGKKLRSFNVKTIAELFEVIYGSKNLRKIASILSVITLFFILIGQGIAARKFFYSLGIDNSYIFLGFWLIVIIYTVMGGLKAVVQTDIIQMLFTLSIFILVFFFSKTYINTNLDPTIPISYSSFNISWVACLLMPLLFMVIEQDMGQRCFAAKSSKAFAVSGIIAAILLMLSCSFAIYLGVLGKKLNLNISINDDVLLTVIKIVTTPTISSLFASAFLMVVLSTADSLLCSISSNLSYDFEKIRNNNNIFLSRSLTFAVGILAMSFSYYFDNIVSIFIQAYEFSVSVFFVPIIFGILSKKKLFFNAAIYSMIVGAVGFCLFRIYSPPIAKEVITLLFSCLTFMTIQYFENRKYQVKIIQKQ